MNTERTERLLRRYYEAQTTDEEEQELRRFFASDNVPPHLQEEQRLFRLLTASDGMAAGDEDVPMPDGLEERLSQLIDSQEPPARQRRARTVSLRWAWAAAASVLLLVAVGLGLGRGGQESTEVVVTDPAQASLMAGEALTLFAETLSMGMDQMEQASDATIEMQTEIIEQLQFLL